MTQREFKRRSLLAGSAGLALAGLAACGGKGAAGSSSGGSAVAPPTYVPYKGVKPDLPAIGDSVPAGFFHYPANPTSMGHVPLAKSQPVSCLLQANQPMTPRAKNRWWQALDHDTGTTLNVNTVQAADYAQKFQVTIAGGQMPDLTMVNMVPSMPQVLEKLFTDLSEVLTGDNVKKYPALASIPTDAWRVATLNGRIWGIPQARPPAGNIVSTRGDLLRKRGIKSNSPSLSSGQDFLDLCRELSDPKRNVYAMGALPTSWMLPAMLEMMGAPNNWKEEGGKFTSVYESEQMKPALTETGKMLKAGYLHPDSFSSPDSNITWWTGGITSLYIQNFAGWPLYTQQNPSWDMGVIKLPKWDGGGAAKKLLGAAAYGDYVAIKKSSDSRMKELLEILNYFASPFGTKEYLTITYGSRGTDYTLKGTDPIATKTSLVDYPQGLLYCGSQEYNNLYVPGSPDTVKAMHSYLADVLSDGVKDPSQGLYSQTSVTKGASATQTVQDAQADIIQGRRPVSDWDSVVSDWRKAAGDAIRSELEKAYAKQHGG